MLVLEQNRLLLSKINLDYALFDTARVVKTLSSITILLTVHVASKNGHESSVMPRLDSCLLKTDYTQKK